MFDPFFHLGTALSATGELTVSNATNIGSGDPFNIGLAINPNTIITGNPVNYTVLVNGAAVPLKNVYGANVSTDKLVCRKRYTGFYFEPTDGSDPYVVIDTRCKPCLSQSSVRAAAATAGG